MFSWQKCSLDILPTWLKMELLARFIVRSWIRHRPFPVQVEVLNDQATP